MKAPTFAVALTMVLVFLFSSQEAQADSVRRGRVTVQNADQPWQSRQSRQQLARNFDQEKVNVQREFAEAVGDILNDLREEW